jgi:hypothetical protein
MRIEDVVVIATVREKCSRNPLVDTAGIESLIEAAQVRVDASDDDSTSSESGVADKNPPPPKEAVTGTSTTEDSYNGTKEESAAITSEAVDMHKNDEHSVSPCGLACKRDRIIDETLR